MDNSTANANSFLIIFFTASNGISVFVCLLAAVLVFLLELHRNVVYRLALYQVLAALALATVEVLEIIFINDSDNKSSGCTAIGWLVVYTQWVKLLFTMWAMVHLFCVVVLYKSPEKLEILCVVTSLLVPVVMASVPLITHSYAINLNRRCYIDQHELVERIVLWDAPAMAILLALSIVMVVVVRKLLRRRSEFEARDQFVTEDSITCTPRPLIPRRASERSEFARFVRAYFLPLAPYPIFLVFIVPVVIMDVIDALSITSPIAAMSIANALFTSLWSLTSGATLITIITVSKYRRRRQHVFY